MSDSARYHVVWRGQRLGPYSLVDLQRELQAGRISLAHQVDAGRGLTTVRDVLEEQARRRPQPQPVAPRPLPQPAEIAEKEPQAVPQLAGPSGYGAPVAPSTLPAPTGAPAVSTGPMAAPGGTWPPGHGQPQVHVAAINPGTAGFLAALAAFFGLPFLGYIQTGKITRGLFVQAIYWALSLVIVVLPVVLGLMGAAAGEEGAALGLLGGMGLTPLIGFLLWIAGIVFSVLDVNQQVKEHNAGRGVKYT